MPQSLRTSFSSGSLRKCGGKGIGESGTAGAGSVGEHLPIDFFDFRCLGGSVFGGEGIRAAEARARDLSINPRDGGALAELAPDGLKFSELRGGNREGTSMSASSNGSLLSCINGLCRGCVVGESSGRALLLSKSNGESSSLLALPPADRNSLASRTIVNGVATRRPAGQVHGGLTLPNDPREDLSEEVGNRM